MKEWMNQRMNESMNEGMNESTNEWIKEWMSEWMNEWMVWLPMRNALKAARAYNGRWRKRSGDRNDGMVPEVEEEESLGMVDNDKRLMNSNIN